MTIPSPLSPLPDDKPHRIADDSEEIYFEGSPLLRAEVGRVIIWWFIGIAVMAIPMGNWLSWHFAWWPWWLSLGFFAVAVFLFFAPIWLRTTLRYRITNYRIDVSYGAISRNTDTIELWHVEDLHLHQSLLNRIVEVGSITIKSRDQQLPLLVLRGLPKPQELFRSLEQRIVAVKRQPGVMKVDPG